MLCSYSKRRLHEGGGGMGKRTEIRVTPFAAVLVLGLILTDDSGLCLVTLLAAVLHECGHFAAARLLRIPLGDLHLDLLGARLEVRGKLLSYAEEWILCAAGPMISLICAAIGGMFWGIEPISVAAIRFSCASLVLGVLNLMPIRTFDGGRMLEVTLLSFFGERVVESVMRTFSFLLLFLLWAVAVYFLLRAGDGLSLFCFSMSLFSRFFEELEGR